MLKMVFKNHIPDKERGSCHDCRHCQAAVTWWCVNEEARERHGTSIPGGIKCLFWEPGFTMKDFTWLQRTFRTDLLFIER